MIDSCEEENIEMTLTICCHRVVLRYWDFVHPITDELKNILEEHGRERVNECINDGCRSGELNCLYDEEEIRGWWEITDD